MKSINLLRNILIKNKKNLTITNRNYFIQSFVRIDNKNTNNYNDTIDAGDLLKSIKLETPPIKSVPGIFRCSINNPLEHASHHIGKFYKIDENEVELLDPFSDMFEQQYLEQCKIFQEKCLMIRQPAIEVINYLKKLDLSRPIYKFLLYSDADGTGKRSTALHVMHYCLRDNWLLLTIPHASGVLRGRRTEFDISTYKEDRIDTPIAAVKFLKRFLIQNEKLLKNLNLKTTKDYVWSGREKTIAGSSIIDLIEFGKERAKFSSDICGALIREIKLQSKDKNLKVLVTIDELNCFFGPTRLRRKEKTDISVDEITIYRNFKKLINPDWTNAVLLGTLNSKGVIIPAPNLHKKKYDTSIFALHRRRKESTVQYEGLLTPKHLLKKEGFYSLEPFISIEVPKYTVQEASNYLEYYKDRNWIQNELATDDDGREEILFLSGRNPFEFMRVCSPL